MKPSIVELENPYLDVYRAALAHEIAAGRTLADIYKQPSGYCTCYECLPVGEMESGRPPYDRYTLVRHYSFAVPDDIAIHAIADLEMPVMEFGAGTGYWAWLLSQTGVEVMAFDLLPPGTPETQNGYHFEKTFFEVYPGDGPLFMEACSFCNEFALMLCWPDYNTSFAHDTLKAYQESGGETLIYVGEDEQGCTADDSFFELLDKEWSLDQMVDIPQWSTIRDYLGIYRRYQ